MEKPKIEIVSKNLVTKTPNYINLPSSAINNTIKRILHNPRQTGKNEDNSQITQEISLLNNVSYKYKSRNNEFELTLENMKGLF